MLLGGGPPTLGLFRHARSHGQQLAYVCYENGRRSNGSDHHQFALE